VLAAAAILPCLAWGPAAAQEEGEPELTYFRIGTGATGGTYFPIGGLIANVISNPPGSRPCERGGSCGVPGLIAVAQSTHGSVDNLDSIGSGTLESGLSQADVAYWAYTGQWTYVEKEPISSLRVIASLYSESIHLVARRDAGIRSVADLRGKRVCLGEPASGTEVDAKVLLGGYGLTEANVEPFHLTPGRAADFLRTGEIDAFILVAGAPVAAIADLLAAAESGPAIDLVPIAGPEADRIASHYPFFTQTLIPAGVYEGIGPTFTIGVGAQWIVSANVEEELVHGITRALWHENSRALLRAGHPKGRQIRLETAVRGIAIPLRYYREVGLIQ
jgi:TRAP transporter TAXI family solute receptor